MLNRAALLAKINSLLPDNLARLITAARLRTILADFTASFLNLTDDAAGFPVSSLTETATQAAHGFAKFSVIRHNGTAWVRTLAVQATDTDASSEVFGVVSQVIDADTFVLTIGGKLDTTGLNLLPGTAYFASPTVPGALTAAPPTQENHVVKAVLITGKANTAYVVNYIGEVLGAGGTTAPGGGNGGADLTNYYTIPQTDTLLGGKVGKTGDETIDGNKTFLKPIIANSTQDVVVVKSASVWQEDDGDGGFVAVPHSEVKLRLDNSSETQSPYELVLNVASDARTQMFFQRPDGTFASGFVFGLASVQFGVPYKGVNLIVPRNDGTSGALRQYILDSVASVNSYYTAAANQKIVSTPLFELTLTITGGVVLLILNQFAVAFARLTVNANFAFAINSPVIGHSYNISVTTDAAARTVTLPANSFYSGPLTLDANSTYAIRVEVFSQNGTDLLYRWTITKYLPA